MDKISVAEAKKYISNNENLRIYRDEEINVWTLGIVRNNVIIRPLIYAVNGKFDKDFFHKIVNNLQYL